MSSERLGRSSHSECLMPGIQQQGPVIKTSKAGSSALDCAFDCMRAAQCEHFVFMKSSGQCRMLASSSSTTVNADSISGDRSCFMPETSTTTTTTRTRVDPYSNPCFLRDVNFKRHDVAVKEARDAFQCAYECSFVDNCCAFSYDTDKGICYMKTAGADGVPQKSYVSGTTECFFPSRAIYDVGTKKTFSVEDGHDNSPTHRCYLSETEFAGSTNAVLKLNNVEDCQKACHEYKDCDFFSFHSKTFLCYLKYSDDGKRSAHGVISADMSCFYPKTYTTTVDPTPPTRSPLAVVDLSNPCFRLNTAYQGRITAVVSARQPSDCGAMCHMRSTCHHFTWNRQTQKCYMRGDIDTLMRNSEATSGSMKCFHPDEYNTTTTTSTVALAEASACFQQGVNYHGNDIMVVGVTSAIDCSLRCHMTEGCHYFSYLSDYRQCYMKYAAENEMHADGVVSGSRYCFFPGDYTTTTTRSNGLCPGCHPGMPGTPSVQRQYFSACFVSGLRYVGAIVAQARLPTANDCASMCRRSFFCEAITYNDGMCQLFVDAREQDAPDYFQSAAWKCLDQVY